MQLIALLLSKSKQIVPLSMCVFFATMAHAQVNTINKPFRAGAPTVSPVDLGIAPYVAPTPTPAPTIALVPARPAQPQVWEVLLTDGNLYKALSRWAHLDGRPVHWEAGKEYPAVYAQYVGSYVQAFEQVMKDTANSSYRLHACEYDNVIRVLHTSQSCRH